MNPTGFDHQVDGDGLSFLSRSGDVLLEELGICEGFSLEEETLVGGRRSCGGVGCEEEVFERGDGVGETDGGEGEGERGFERFDEEREGV